jgi:hypothetical protein
MHYTHYPENMAFHQPVHIPEIDYSDIERLENDIDTVFTEKKPGSHVD